MSTVVYLVSRMSPAEWRVEQSDDGEDFENDFNMKNSAWFVAGAIMGQGSELSPV